MLPLDDMLEMFNHLTLTDDIELITIGTEQLSIDDKPNDDILELIVKFSNLNIQDPEEMTFDVEVESDVKVISDAETVTEEGEDQYLSMSSLLPSIPPARILEDEANEYRRIVRNFQLTSHRISLVHPQSFYASSESSSDSEDETNPFECSGGEEQIEAEEEGDYQNSRFEEAEPQYGFSRSEYLDNGLNSDDEDGERDYEECDTDDYNLFQYYSGDDDEEENNDDDGGGDYYDYDY